MGIGEISGKYARSLRGTMYVCGKCHYAWRERGRLDYRIQQVCPSCGCLQIEPVVFEEEEEEPVLPEATGIISPHDGARQLSWRGKLMWERCSYIVYDKKGRHPCGAPGRIRLDEDGEFHSIRCMAHWLW